MNSLFYYLVTAHEHQEGYEAVAKTTELYHENKELFEKLWMEAVENCDKRYGFSQEDFTRLLAIHGLYIQFDSETWNHKDIVHPVYELDLRIYPVDVGKVACLKVSVHERKV